MDIAKFKHAFVQKFYESQENHDNAISKQVGLYRISSEVKKALGGGEWGVGEVSQVNAVFSQ